LVIAEASDLPTKFGRLMVTDDRGRYLVPDLPQASYDVRVRGRRERPDQHREPVRGTPPLYAKWLDARIEDLKAGGKGADPLAR
jgi:hypothetical protein